MDKEQILLTRLQAINWIMIHSMWSFAAIFLTKYVNIELAIQYLGVGGFISAAISIIICQYGKNDKILNWCLKHIYSILVISNLLQGLTIALIWIDPFVYLIGSAISTGSIENALYLAFGDIQNKIYKNRDKTKLTALNWQCAYLGGIIGSGAAIIFGDCPFNLAVIIGIAAMVIDIPISWWRLNIMIRRLKRENHDICAQD